MNAILQAISIHWSKAARGAPLAQKRAAIPDHFDLHLDDEPDTGGNRLYLHQINLVEWRDFTPAEQLEVRDLDDKTDFAHLPVSLLFDGESLQVVYRYVEWMTGAPRRRTKTGKLFTLSTGESARLSLNGRFGNGWSYKKTVINIALEDGIPDSSRFAARPNYQLKDEHKLW